MHAGALPGTARAAQPVGSCGCVPPLMPGTVSEECCKSLASFGVGHPLLYGLGRFCTSGRVPADACRGTSWHGSSSSTGYRVSYYKYCWSINFFLFKKQILRFFLAQMAERWTPDQIDPGSNLVRATPKHLFVLLSFCPHPLFRIVGKSLLNHC